MAVIDSNNFITHLVWSGLLDKATCGELKKAIELCTVKDIYTKADMAAMLEVIKLRIDNLPEPLNRDRVNYCIQEKINSLKADQEGT